MVIIYNTLFSAFGSCLASDGDATERGGGIDCLKASVKLRYAYCTAGWPELSYAVVKYGKTFESCAVLYSPSSLLRVGGVLARVTRHCSEDHRLVSLS